MLTPSVADHRHQEPRCCCAVLYKVRLQEGPCEMSASARMLIGFQLPPALNSTILPAVDTAYCVFTVIDEPPADGHVACPYLGARSSSPTV